jgi:hypothetical protein
MRKFAALAAVVPLLAAVPAGAQTSRAIGSANAYSAAIAGGGGGGPLGNTPDVVAPSILTQSNECPAEGTSFGIGAPYAGIGFGHSRVDQRLSNPCQMRQDVYMLGKLAVTFHNSRLARWGVNILCQDKQLGPLAPAEECPENRPAASPAWHWNSAYQSYQWGDTAYFANYVTVGGERKLVTNYGSDPK